MNFLIIGSNFIVDAFMAAAQQVEGFCLHTVYSRSMEQARQNQAKWGALYATSDLAQAAADPDIECAYIASPNSLHFSQAKALLLAGKHVFCEKPICLCAAELSELLHVAREKQLVLLEAMRPLFLPNQARIREVLPSLGRLRYAEFCYCQYSSRYDKFQAGIIENAFRRELGNGALMDIGIYCLSYMEYLFGKPLSMRYLRRELPRSIDITGVVLAEYPDFDAVARFSKVHDSLPRKALIEGEQGSLELLHFPIIDGMRLQLRGQEARTEYFTQYEQDMRYEIEAFCRLYQNRQAAETYNQHSLAAMEMVDELLKN